MDSYSFNVRVRKKIPYVTNNLIALMFGFIFMFFLCDILFLPTRYASPEMTAAYYKLAIPFLIKKLMALGVIGTLVTGILQAIMRQYKLAVLTFSPEQISIEGKKINMVFPLHDIFRIYAEDIRYPNGLPKLKFKLDLIDKNQKATVIQLIDYSLTEDLMNVLMQYNNLDIRLTEFRVVNAPEDEN